MPTTPTTPTTPAARAAAETYWAASIKATGNAHTEEIDDLTAIIDRVLAETVKERDNWKSIAESKDCILQACSKDLEQLEASNNALVEEVKALAAANDALTNKLSAENLNAHQVRLMPHEERGRTAAYPVFSDADDELRKFHWTKCTKGGYARFRCQRREVMAHRLVVSRMLGRTLTPNDVVDHIDGDKYNNRRENLRLTDHAGNSQNRPNMPFRGTSITRGGRWRAHVNHKKKHHYLGTFDSREEAAAVAEKKRTELGFLGHSHSQQGRAGIEDSSDAVTGAGDK